MLKLVIVSMLAVLERFPGLKIVSAENDIGWAGSYIQRLDHTMRKHGPRYNIDLPMMPSDYFHRNVFCTFMEDEAGLRIWDVIGAQNLLWSNDYPHFDSTWPHSQEVTARQFQGVPDHVKAMILAGNVKSLYHIN
jgi:predicted TIM-barrel fold metal-dependent hydrolase